MIIWKYPIPIRGDGHEIIEIPTGFERFLSVQLQHGEPILWVMVSQDAPKLRWHFHWVGTGHDVPEVVQQADGDTYIGTVQVGAFVFHLFHSGYESTEAS